MENNATLLMAAAACAFLSQLFKHSFLGYIFAGGLCISILIFIFVSITSCVKINEKSKR